MSTRKHTGFVTIRGRFLLPAVLALFLPALFHGATAQQQLAPGARAPTSQAPAPLAGAQPVVPAATPPNPGAATPPGAPSAAIPPVAADMGLCQCIADKTSLGFTCPGSVDACRSACGNQFSFKPDARCSQTAATH